MRAHVVSFRDAKTGTKRKNFVASEAEGRQLRMKWMEEHKLKRKDITVEPIDIPTGKAELLAFLNSL